MRKHERKGKGLNIGRKEGGKVIAMDERKEERKEDGRENERK